jgi:hypothetical protein
MFGMFAEEILYISNNRQQTTDNRQQKTDNSNSVKLRQVETSSDSAPSSDSLSCLDFSSDHTLGRVRFDWTVVVVVMRTLMTVRTLKLCRAVSSY